MRMNQTIGLRNMERRLAQGVWNDPEPPNGTRGSQRGTRIRADRRRSLGCTIPWISCPGHSEDSDRKSAGRRRLRNVARFGTVRSGAKGAGTDRVFSCPGPTAGEQGVQRRSGDRSCNCHGGTFKEAAPPMSGPYRTTLAMPVNGTANNNRTGPLLERGWQSIPAKAEIAGVRVADMPHAAVRKLNEVPHGVCRKPGRAFSSTLGAFRFLSFKGSNVQSSPASPFHSREEQFSSAECVSN